MISLRLDPGRHWVQVDLTAPPGEWAADTVRQRWEAQGRDLDPHRAEMVTASVARIVGALDAAALDAALLLHPAADGPVLTVLGLRAYPAPPGRTLDALGEELSVPEEMLERPRECSDVQTPAGSAVRLVQRYREPCSSGVEEVREHVAYGWLVAGRDQINIVVASTTFIDLVAAGTWIGALDELARSATVQPLVN